MTLTWKRDTQNNRVVVAKINGREYIGRVYPTGIYSVIAVLGKTLSGRLSIITLLSGRADSLAEGISICENKLNELSEGKKSSTEVPKKENIPNICFKEGNCFITFPSEAEIKYTTNGKDVKKTNKVYKEPFSVEKGTVIKAIAYYDDSCSSQATEEYK